MRANFVKIVVALLWAVQPLIVDAATPIGTTISNSAKATYTVAGVGGYQITSAPNQFVVVGLGGANSVSVQNNVAGTKILYGGETLNFQITLTNTGDNVLYSEELHVHAPPGSIINILGLTAGPTSGTFLLPDLQPFESIALSGQLTLPIDAIISQDSLVAEYHANGQTFPLMQLQLQILNRTRSRLELLQYDATGNAAPFAVMPTEYRAIDGSFVALPPPNVPDPNITALVTDQPLSLVPATTFSHDQILFIRVNDADQNQDSTVADKVTVTIDIPNSSETETLRLTETAVDSGVFTGYMRISMGTGAADDGALTVQTHSKLNARYTDLIDAGDAVTWSALVDPYGRLFDSETGVLLNGFTIRLINADTGAAAKVYGDDGVSNYPSTLVTGGSAVDSGGTAYNFDVGSFRFPFVEPGNYRLVVYTPKGTTHRAPSTKTDQQLAGLPGEFVIGVGSRGETFTVNPGPPLRLDIPMDPLVGQLYIQREASKQLVDQGGFVAFEASIENTASVPINNMHLNDQLAHGFRVRAGSVTIDGVPAANPSVTANGTLDFALGSLPAQTTTKVRYVVEVGAAKPGNAVSRSVAVGNGGAITSNTVEFSTRVLEDLFRSRNVLMGSVVAISPEDGVEYLGISGVRIYLEDGTYTVTDERGQYKFEGVRPGTHVVQVDAATLPDMYELVAVEDNTATAGRAWSRFVELQGGTLWRVDFHAKSKPNQQGNMRLELNGEAQSSGALLYKVKLDGAVVPVRNLRLMVMLPEGTQYRESLFDGGLALVPQVQDNMLVYHLPGAEGQWQHTLAISALFDSQSDNDELIAKAMLIFDTPRHKNQRTPLATHTLRRDEKEMGYLGRFEPQDVAATVVVQTQGLRPGETWAETVAHNAPTAAAKVASAGEANGNESAPYSSAKHTAPGDQAAPMEARLNAPMISDGGLTKVSLNFAPLSYGLLNKPTLRRTVREIGRSTQEFTVRPKFGVREIALDATDQARLDNLVQQLTRLEDVRVEIIGHSDNLPLRDTTEFADNTELSRARAMSVARYLMAQLDDTPMQIDVIGRGSLEPIADNDTEEGRAANRRVEVRVLADQVDRIAVLEADPMLTPPTPEELIDDEIAKYDQAWLKNAAPGTEWLVPVDNALRQVPSVSVAIKHDAQHKVTLLLNGAAVAAENFNGTLTNDRDVALSRWSGIDLIEGYNRLEAVFSDDKGVEVERLERMVRFAGPPVRAELVDEQSMLVADGMTSPAIAIRLFDRHGIPVREGLIGDYSVDTPYLPLPLQAFDAAKLPGAPVQKYSYTVGDDGVAVIHLLATGDVGDVYLNLPMSDGQTQRLIATLKPKVRDWILVGLAEGTAGYNAISGNTEPLEGDAAKDHLYQDGRIAFFAKGRVRGEWLLTMAYDSAKTKPRPPELYRQDIDPNSFYTVYGDNSRQQSDAESSRKLYVRVERDEFFAMFGDYNTGFTTSELSQYNRALTGLKSRYHQGRYDVVVFSSESNQAFVRDDIGGNGITGPYEFSRKNIVINSEQIVIEVRDRFRSEEILSQKLLTRHVDYDINYDKGTVVFREPVFSTDADLNHVFIVAKYESFDSRDVDRTYGGRGAVVVGNNTTMGVTHIKEGLTGGKAQLSGLDITHAFTPNTQVRIEAAHSENANNDSGVNSDAYIAEFGHRAASWNGRAYYRKQDNGFGLGQTSGAGDGTQKIGAEGSIHPSSRIFLKGQAYRHEVFATEAIRYFAEAQTHLLVDDKTEVRVGGRAARDDLGNGTSQVSNLLTAGASRSFMNNKLRMRVDREQSLGDAENVDFPSRTRAGADLQITTKTALFAEQELANGAVRDTRNTRVGIKASPWQGSEIASTVTQQNADRSVTRAGVSMRQKIMITDYWSIDFGAEDSRVVSQEPGVPFNTNVPFASGRNDGFTAGSFGLTYNPGNWLWSSRVEARDADSQNSWSLLSSVQTNPSANLGLLTSLSLFGNDRVTGQQQNDINLRLGLAYRPYASKWMVLNRVDVIYESDTGGAFDSRNARIVNNINTHYSATQRWKLAFQYGAKYLRETIDTVGYADYLDLIGVESRFDLTKQWDISFNTSMLHAWKLNQFDYMLGASVGHSFVKNMWLSAGFNLAGFQDKDFSRNEFTSVGPYIRFRMKFDQQSIREVAEWLKI